MQGNLIFIDKFSIYVKIYAVPNREDEAREKFSGFLFNFAGIRKGKHVCLACKN